MLVLLDECGCPIAHPAHPWDRLLTRMRAQRLDTELARGASPDATVALALRVISRCTPGTAIRRRGNLNSHCPSTTKAVLSQPVASTVTRWAGRSGNCSRSRSAANCGVTSTSAVHCDPPRAGLCPLATSGYLNIAPRPPGWAPSLPRIPRQRGPLGALSAEGQQSPP